MSFGRTFLYHRDTPLGKIFTDEAEFKQALNSGWKEAPWLVNETDVVTETKESASNIPPPAPVVVKKSPGRPRKKIRR